MRALLLSAVVLATACTDGTLDQDTTFRRLVDQYDSEAQCLAEGDLAPCYQTLALCSSGLVRIDLVNRPEDGAYELKDGSIAIARFIDKNVEFDLDARTSAQLPGRHAWEQVTPLVDDCGE